MTVWRPVPSNLKYIVSDDGRVRHNQSARELKPAETHRGYLAVTLSGEAWPRRVHRIVAEAFIPNPNDYPYVGHINHDKQDNRVENLEWCTQKMNLDRSAADGRMPNRLSEAVTRIPAGVT